MRKLSLSAVVAVLASTIAAPTMAQFAGDQSYAPGPHSQCAAYQRGSEGGHDTMAPHPGGATAFFIPTPGPAERGNDALAEGESDVLSSGTSFAMSTRGGDGRGHDALDMGGRDWSSPVQMASAGGLTAAC